MSSLSDLSLPVEEGPRFYCFSRLDTTHNRHPRSPRGTTTTYAHANRRNRLPAGQPSPEGPPIELTAVTEAELRGPGAVKLLYRELTELKATHNDALAELKNERNRNDILASKANSSDKDHCILKERLRATGHRHAVVRLIEVVIVVLLAYAIDFAKSGSWTNLVVFLILAVVLWVTIYLIDRGAPAAGD